MKDRNGIELAKGDHVIVCLSKRSSTLVEGVVTYVAPNKVNFRVTSASEHSIAYDVKYDVGEVHECRVSHRVRVCHDRY